MNGSERDHDVVEVVLRKASDLGLVFNQIDALDHVEIGATRYLRLQADLKEVSRLVDAVHAGGRGVIGLSGTKTYEVRIGGRKGTVPHSRMQMAPRACKSYRGTGNPLWERQFLNQSSSEIRM